jgi:predicted permease
MNGTVLAFAVGVSAMVALALGLLIGARAARRDPRMAMADGGRGQAGASSQRLGRTIVTVQMAMTIVLLTGAALLGRSLLQVLAVDPGFRTDGIVAMDLVLPEATDAAGTARLVPLYTGLFERLRAIPGVEQVAAANAVPLDGGLPDGLFLVVTPNDVPKTRQELSAAFRRKEATGTADYSAVSPDYFRALDIPLRRGRLFDDRDGPNAPHVAVITESLARARWPDTDPIGATIEFGNMDGDLRPITIVGIVGDVRVYGLERPASPTLYVNLMQRPKSSATVVMRTAIEPQTIIAAARRVLKESAPDVPPRFRTFEQMYAASLGDRRFNLTLVMTFAGTALALAVAGIYGVMSYTVAQRRREMGVRIAFGATRGQVLRIIIGQGLGTTAAGVALGTLAAFGLARTVEHLLFGITSTDPLAFAGAIGVLMTVALLACYVPARRAMHVEPIEALRED